MRKLVHCTRRTGQSLRQRSQFLSLFSITALIFTAVTAFAVQDSPAVMATSPRHSRKAAAQKQETPAPAVNLGEYGPLVEEFAHLAAKVQQGVQVPAPRTQSKLLPMLPASTSVYVSLPNFGETLYQANQIFNQEVQDSTVLRDWWQNKVGVAGMMVEGVIEQIHQFTGYLGDEIVISGSVKSKGGSLLILADIRKPGLKAFLQQLLDQYGGPNAPVQILTPQQLLTAKAPAKSNPLLILIRPDVLVASSDLTTLRSANAQLTRGGGTFNSSAFGQRLAQAYQGGVGMLAGADLQKLLALRPQGKQQEEAILKQTGFADLKYLIIDGKYAGGVSSSNMEMTFNGPRQGIAAWLGAPTSLSGLDFVSTKAMSAGAIALKNPAQMFDDIKNLAEAANPMASMGLAQAETELKINLRDDLFSKLGGELAFALESSEGPTPGWKAMARVSDPDGLQKTLKVLMTGAIAKAMDGKEVTLDQRTEDGLTYSSVGFTNKDKREEIAYALTDGYLVVASTPALLKEAIKVHHSGNSLGRSSEFRKLLPLEHSGQASALFFQNTGATMKAMMQQLPPELGQFFQSLNGQNKFSVMTAYAEDNAIRASSNSQQMNLVVPLVVAAVAIPNLMKAKTEATSSSAAAIVRTLNTAEVTYQIQYGKFAPDLASMGPGARGNCDKPTEQNACILDAKLGAANCSSGTWCAKDAFQFTILTDCQSGACQDYTIIATPTDRSRAGKSFCSTSDAVVRSRSGLPLSQPINSAECQTWQPI